MIRNRAFKGFFIMKKDNGGDWEYLSSYWRRGDNVKLSFSKSDKKVFSDNTIQTALPWSVFSRVRDAYPSSRLILYAEVNGKMQRVKYYDPSSENRIISWLSPSDFSAYIPIKI